MITLCKIGLNFQFFKTLVQFMQDIGYPVQIFTGIEKAVFCLPATFPVFGHARRFFKKGTKFFRTRFDDARYHTLPDNGVGSRAQSGTQKNILNVPATHGNVIDEISRAAFPRQDALDRQLTVLPPLTCNSSIRIVENEFNRSPTGWLALRRTVENNVMHRLTAQFRSPGLSQHPADCVDDIRFATAIWPDNADQFSIDPDRCGIDKRLETRQFDGR